AGRRVRMKAGIPALVDLLRRGFEDAVFSFFVISAAPREVVVSALAGLVPAGYGKVAVIEELIGRLDIARDRMIYVGDGSSDVHVMLHVNNHDGFTIAVSENRQLARIANSTVISDNALSVMVPVLDQVLGWQSKDIRTLFESNGLILHEWERARTDHVTISDAPTMFQA